MQEQIIARFKSAAVSGATTSPMTSYSLTSVKSQVLLIEIFQQAQALNCIYRLLLAIFKRVQLTPHSPIIHRQHHMRAAQFSSIVISYCRASCHNWN